MSERQPVRDWASDFVRPDPQWVENPYPVWKQFRTECPIAHTTRFADMRAITCDTEHVSSRRLFVRERHPSHNETPPVTPDPPKHRAQHMLLLLMPPRASAQPDERPPGMRRNELRLRMPVDPLTHLMMDADGISVSEMEALMQRINRTLEERSAIG